MTGADVLRAVLASGRCALVRVKGSHHIVRCAGEGAIASCQASIPVHRGQDLPIGTRRTIAERLRPCLGEEQEWMP